MACAPAASDATSPSSSPTPRPSGESSGANAAQNPLAPDLDIVPPVDTTIAIVAISDVIFDTFNGGFVRLDNAGESQIRQLRDAIRPIYDPSYGDAESLPWLRDEDVVIGFLSDSGAYAYPLKPLNFRELVNDVIDGQPVLITYCPLCGSGVVYSRVVDGETLLFGNTSALFESDLVMYDHQTGSYWFQVLGEAIVGEMTGTRLPVLPSVTMTWGDWKAANPDTRLLYGDQDERFDSRFASDSFSTYADRLNDGRFAFPVSEDHLDQRLRAGEIVLSVEVDGNAKAYPIDQVSRGVVNDEIGDTPVAILTIRQGVGAGAYLAEIDGRRLTFDAVNNAVVDRETGSTWDAAGRAIDGPLEGAALQLLPSRRAFWFSIALALPGIELYQP